MTVKDLLLCEWATWLSESSGRMTIQPGSAGPARSCARQGHKRNALRWDLPPPEIRTMTDSLISRVERVYDEVGALKMEKVNVENAWLTPDWACKSGLFPFTPYKHTHSRLQISD